jgi:hypothetical protein
MNTLRQIRQIVYRLKRDFGTPAVLLKTVSSALDVETGAVNQTVDSYPIRRAVILPRTIVREFSKQGHTNDTSKRFCLISRADITVNIGQGDHLQINGEKYSVAPVESDLSDMNYLLELLRVEGQ